MSCHNPIGCGIQTAPKPRMYATTLIYSYGNTLSQCHHGVYTTPAITGAWYHIPHSGLKVTAYIMSKYEKYKLWDRAFGFDPEQWKWKEWPKRFGYYYLRDSVAIQISDPDLPF